MKTGLGKHWEETPIQLPGTLDDAELGEKNKLQPAMSNYVLSGLTRKHQYIGAPWNQKEKWIFQITGMAKG